MTFSRRAFLACAAALPLARIPSALAQATFPSRAVKIIVPFAPGGSNDYIARILSPKMSAVLSQPVVIENKSGAGGAIGAQAVAHAAPDGYTALFHSSTLVIQPQLVKEAFYDVRSDFTPVSVLAQAPLVLVVHPSVPAKNFSEFLAYARAKGSELFYGSAGIGSNQHLALELFNSMAGTKIKHVPYRGGGPAGAALLAGEVQCCFDIIPTSKPLVEKGKLRALAVTSSTRTPSMPQLPTIHEAGVPNFDFTFWQAMSLPKGTSAPIVQVWLNALKKALEDKEVQARLLDQGYQVVGSTPEQLADLMKSDYARWGKVIADAGIKGE